jgi:DNA-binding response OmpR family regulator
MSRARILVVEDDPRAVVFIMDQLEYAGYTVEAARDGEEGLAKAQQLRPDLVVLDVMMPRMDGYEVCDRLKSSADTRNIPILMLTAKGQAQDKVRGFATGADDYLAKPFDGDEFAARVKALLKRGRISEFLAFSVEDEDCVFSMSCKPDQKIHLRTHGSLSLSDTTDKPLSLDADAYAREADNAPRLDWRFSSKQCGSRLYDQLFTSHPKVLANYSQALGTVECGDRLRICLETTRELLRVPFEFLYWGLDAAGDYFVLKHPFYRTITGVPVRRAPLSPDFLNDLRARRLQLKVLLIASNTTPTIPGVDQEITEIGRSLGTPFADRGISVAIKTIPTEHATYATVTEELRKREYHVLHYAGHGTYVRESPEKSYLSFWKSEDHQGGLCRLPISDLQILVRNSGLRFVYLSCCLGGKAGEQASLLDGDFLGIADGIVHAGVPSVLAFRWPVADSGALAMALSFYRSLAAQGRIEVALFEARCEVARINRDDITWLSPILIMQAYTLDAY